MVSPPTEQGAAVASAVRGFKLLRLPLAAGSPVSRTLLVKRHEERNPSDRTAEGRTLFVTHIDSFVTEAQLARCFSNAFGPVDRVELKSAEKKASRAELRADFVKVFVNFARVVFKDSDGLEKVLNAANGRIVGTAVLPPPPSELKEQLRKAKNLYPDPAVLRREIDEWMVKYDEQQEENKRLARENQVDEDGFTKVISGTTKTADGMVVHSARRPTLKTGAFSEPIHGRQESDAVKTGKKKKKSKEQPDFYRFQLREQRRDEVADHRKRKAEAEEKVERLKKARRSKAAKAAV